MTTDKTGVFSGLSNLIDELLTLYRRVSATLLADRMDKEGKGGGDASDIDIAEQLVSVIDVYAAQSNNSRVGETEWVDEARGGSQDVPETIQEKKNAVSGSLGPNELSRWISDNAGQGASESQIARNLEANAGTHISRALSLGRAGKAREAAEHARFAENAIKTAASYMSPEEFNALKRRVRDRLDRLKQDL